MERLPPTELMPVFGYNFCYIRVGEASSEDTVWQSFDGAADTVAAQLKTNSDVKVMLVFFFVAAISEVFGRRGGACASKCFLAHSFVTWRARANRFFQHGYFHVVAGRRCGVLVCVS